MRNAGFSLLQVLISLAILSFIALATLSALLNNSHNVALLKERNTAIWQLHNAAVLLLLNDNKHFVNWQINLPNVLPHAKSYLQKQGNNRKLQISWKNRFIQKTQQISLSI
ncbi:MAG: hypothetical protein COB50_01045 [Thiotrichales bacterium]|nr:MAG: hypothetical protein COB50_01045 [Thiotrichales bacterium]